MICVCVESFVIIFPHCIIITSFQPRTHDGYYSDTYAKYPISSSNQHDDSKLRDKYKSTGAPRPPDRASSKNDPYRFTRSTAKPYKTATIDKSKLSDLSAKYRLVSWSKTCNTWTRAYADTHRSLDEMQLVDSHTLKSLINGHIISHPCNLLVSSCDTFCYIS